jgi:hypothetical protein
MNDFQLGCIINIVIGIILIIMLYYIYCFLESLKENKDKLKKEEDNKLENENSTLCKSK